MRVLSPYEMDQYAGGDIIVDGPGGGVIYPGEWGGGGGDGGESGGGSSGGGGGWGDGQGPAGTSIELDFIKQHEGAGVKDGYVPRDANGHALGNSGVTIGSGVDLGARNHQDLVNIGLYPGLIEKLEPYLGLQGQAAINYENAHPLELSENDVLYLDLSVYSSMTKQLVNDFNNASTLDFQDLPSEAQTVIADVMIQYGNGGIVNETPNFWSQVTNGQWEAAYQNLMNFGDDYPSRRQDEAGLIRSAIDSGKFN